ncbi:delta tubulin, putative [Leishmania donovani]|uniref:Delta tubulin, putative n=1 Tax=Leishmania donovani TaxID=5661 RepID=A0A3Q8IPL1_LEIDO|nr:delta tubulin, putative [Leishmania donovani]AYU83878.1 tubulin delta chain [Leishmania donovani]TPP48628.1 Tubulin/FtsZ family, GTPase domain protein [Leishmania donovani]CBZ38959.1 delta tubulin, putative [Leishmania donovani]
MATVHVFVGQCGNQVGTAFLDTIASEAEASVDEGYQMRVSAMDFRPALRPPPARPHHQRSAVAGSATGPSREPSEVARRIGHQQYYSLSYYAQEKERAAIDTSLPQPRCVLVDMEPKVIAATVQRANGQREQHESSPSSSSSPQSASRRLYSLAPQQCVTRGEGSANNWAFGYHQQGQSRRDAIVECLRRESEQQGTVVSTFHVLHSIAGGTGSGVSCLVAEEIKTMFPRSMLLHSVVWPFRCGEVVTQWYNVVMAVSTLGGLADGVFIAYNDAIAEELKGARANRGFKDAGEVSFQLINQRISGVLAPLHLPQLLYTLPSPQKDLSKNRILGTGSGAAQGILGSGPSGCVAEGAAPQRYATASDVVEALSLDPAMKFFTGSLAPQMVTGSTTWAAVLGEAARTAQHSFTAPSALASSADTGFSCSEGKATTGRVADASVFYMQNRSCLWAIRGVAAHTDGIRELRHLMADTASSPFPMTSLFVSPAEEWRATPSYTRPDHSVTLYGPTPMVGASLADAAGRAEELLHVGAFVHHFERYGVSKTELRDAAAVLYDTAAAYHL